MKRILYRVLAVLFLSITLAACQNKIQHEPTVLPTVKVIPITTQTTTPGSPIETVEGLQPDKLEISYTEDDPLSNTEEILKILDQLEEREFAWFSQTGWLHFSIDSADASDFTRVQHFLIHVTDQNLGCAEQFVYYEYEGKLLPYTIRLKNGSTVGINPSDGSLYTDFVHLSSPKCSLKSNWIVSFSDDGDDFDFFLHNESAQFSDFVNSNLQGVEKKVLAWKEDLDGKPTLVLVFEKNFSYPSTPGSIYDARTGVFNYYVREKRWFYIEIERGLLIQKRNEYFDKDGQLLNSWRSGTNYGIFYSYEYFENFPQSVAHIYDKAFQDFNILLQKAEK